MDNSGGGIGGSGGSNGSGGGTCGAGGCAQGLEILSIDPWLSPYRGDIEMRMAKYEETRAALTCGGRVSLAEFANGHHFYGFHKEQGRWRYREWAPAAESLHLMGDFNGWNRGSHPLAPDGKGNWEIVLQGESALPHESRVKVRVTSRGVSRDRIPLYARRVVQDYSTNDFSAQIWDPPRAFAWRSAAPPPSGAPVIYEAHIGMAQNREGVGTYAEFAENVLPRIKAGGYDTVQIMALAEHPYYASFGYQVANFFAPSSRFGTPDELRALIDEAHRLGLRVLMDLVHSHAATNVNEGINEFDGTQAQFFRLGAHGSHEAWGTLLFNYGKHEVIHFLLSNVKYWLEEFRLDGFRFDGVTSMAFLDHGLGAAFDNYGKYFTPNTDFEALVYMQLANSLIHEMRPDALTVAEDMSGYPGMCLPIGAGGIGFDCRLAMGVPDFWVGTLKTRSDEQLDLRKMWHELTTRRPQERNIGYCESHDQALVGDKTIMFWLADKDMYDGMSMDAENVNIDRAVALHKMIRFVTLTLAGEGYLNFIGNEFGHPEWIDFPREGNGWSYAHAKRRWDLADRDDLRYRRLLEFDQAMISFAKENGVFGATDLLNLWVDDAGKLLAYRKAGLVFLLNFNPTRSFEGYELPLPHGTPPGSRWAVAFDSDGARFGGHGRICGEAGYAAIDLMEKHGNVGLKIYSPSRTAMALRRLSD